MDPYTRELLTLLKEQYTRCNGERQYRTESELQRYWLKNPAENLIHPMDANACKAYEDGAGKEISSGKIGALKSSSALTYNLFWDQIAELTNAREDSRPGNGVYKVEFEKKFHPLRTSNFPAHLDAFLYCKHTKEAIACEMKMTEWIFNKPGMLQASYLDPDNYINAEAGKVFVSLAKELIPHEIAVTQQERYPCVMKRYDAFQMFKHIAACYTACKKEEPREIRKLTLVNCIWTIQDPSVLGTESRSRYMQEEQTERLEFEQFRRTMAPVRDLFADCGVEFAVCFYPFAEFLALFAKTPEETEYLQRYIL